MLPSLRAALAVYRMVFGQPRQDDLLEYLMRRLTPERLAAVMECVRIDLAPPDSHEIARSPWCNDTLASPGENHK